MKPLRLTMQGFGTFAERLVIDFRNCLDRRLFGFYGETGGGKTSILDGMCFALFGESSGAERKGEDLRSHHVGPETETYVEFVFEIGSRRYFIRRTPEQTVKAKRGSGETTRQHGAQLYDATGIDIEQISAENCGALLAERVSPVGEKITEILGYLAPQFRQIVLLPQGQFRDLLTAKSDKRSEILRRLFDVSLYERLVEELKSEERTLETQVREARQSIGSLLAQHGVSDVIMLSQLIATGQAERAAAEIERDRLNAANIAANEALSAGKLVAEKFAEQRAAQAALDLLGARQPTITALETRLSRVAHARSVVPLDDRLAEKTRAVNAAKALLEAARAEKVAAETAFENASTALKASESRANERVELAREVARLTELEQRVSKAVPVAEEAGRLKRLAETALASFTEADNAAKAAEAVLAAARNEEAEAQKRQTRIAELVGVVQETTRQRDEAKKYAQAKANVEQRKEALEGAESEWTAARTVLVTAETRYLESEAALSEAQAVHLASKLVDGEPCSVCGSEHHPSPATGSAESKGLNKAFEDARGLRIAAAAKERQAHSKQVEAAALLSAAKAHLEGLTTPQATIKEVEASLASAQEELSDLKLQLGAETARNALIEADRKSVEAKQALELARVSKDETASASRVCAERLEAAFDGVDDSLRTSSAVAAAVEAAQSKVSRARLAHEAAVSAEREAQRAADLAVSGFNHQNRATDGAAEEAHQAQTAFAEAVDALGWTQADYATAKTDIQRQDELTGQVQKFNSDMQSARDRLSRAAEALQNLAEPDLQLLTLAAQEAGTEHRNAVVKHAELSTAISQQAATEARCSEIQQSINDAEARYAVVGELKNMTSGNNSMRMSLADYAVAATLEDVLEAANIRFTRMSRGRFALQRRAEMKDARSRAGLEIMVHDAHTDRPRDAYTLSGGESFMAALSLALGLSDVVQQRAGGIKLDVIFIDEGFGSLDEQTLDVALLTLRDLVGSNRAVGVISHVEAVKQQIQAGFDILRGSRGSRVTPRTMQ